MFKESVSLPFTEQECLKTLLEIIFDKHQASRGPVPLQEQIQPGI